MLQRILISNETLHKKISLKWKYLGNNNDEIILFFMKEYLAKFYHKEVTHCIIARTHVLHVCLQMSKMPQYTVYQKTELILIYCYDLICYSFDPVTLTITIGLNLENN